MKKKLYLLFRISCSLYLFFIACPALAQSSTCGTDTLNYTFYKTTQFRGVSLNASNSGNSFAQWYPAPQPITVYGFEFYGWQSMGTNAVVNITCNLYLAGKDSLPQGSPLRSVTLSIDSTFGNGVLAKMKRIATFSTPVTVNGAYVLTVETSSSTSVSVICNDYINEDGNQEWLSSVRIGANYVRSYNVNVSQIPFDADFIIQPHVGYSLKSDFFINKCNPGGDTIKFKNTSSPVIFNRFYNLYAYYNIHEFCFSWDYGDSSGLYFNIDGNHYYDYAIPYPVTLKDTLFGWTKGCGNTITKTLNPVPSPPHATNDGPHCSKQPLKLFADSVANAIYNWSGPKGFISADRNPVILSSDSSHSGTYAVKIIVNGCASKDTTTDAMVYQTPEVPAVTNDGPKCVGDTVNFSAASASPGIHYVWSGPNFFNDTNTTFSITQLDTTHAGNYSVYVYDDHCTSDTGTTTLYIYPPPVAPLLSVLTKDTLCAGDTLFLKGSSVTGAVFDWTGPDNFTSSGATPVIPAAEPIHSGYYVAKVLIGSCTSPSDSIAILVNALPATSAINGSDTSTETYEKNYNVTETPGSVYYWTVTGGTQVSGGNDDSIAVQWGAPGTGTVKVVEQNAAGCFGEEQQLQITINKIPDVIDTTDTSSGSIQRLASGLLQLYPNPANDQVYLTLNATAPVEMSWQLFDLMGRTVISNEPVAVVSEYRQRIDVSALPHAVYFLRARIGQEETVMRLIVR